MKCVKEWSNQDPFGEETMTKNRIWRRGHGNEIELQKELREGNGVSKGIAENRGHESPVTTWVYECLVSDENELQGKEDLERLSVTQCFQLQDERWLSKAESTSRDAGNTRHSAILPLFQEKAHAMSAFS
jgi:hypothetical protein